MAGLSWVGVDPDHRRRGVLSTMLEQHFADLHQRGEALAGLHASETAIYGRFGYAVAALDAVVERSAPSPRRPGSTSVTSRPSCSRWATTTSASASTHCTSPSPRRPSARSRAHPATRT